MRQIVLASGSPRRKELLEMLGVQNLHVLPARGEELAPENAHPGDIVKSLASAKAREVAARCAPEDVIIAADTIVWFDGKKYGKPHSKEEAASMLRELSGNDHEVYTGVTVIADGMETTEFEMTKVCFRDLSENEIQQYIATGEPMDKAGAYGIQGIGSLFILGIEGDFFNVMGLPLCHLGQILTDLGVRLL